MSIVHTKTVDITLVSVVIVMENLWCHVGHGTGALAHTALCSFPQGTKVANLDNPPLVKQEEVLTFQVSKIDSMYFISILVFY